VDRELVLTGVDTVASHVDICDAITRITALVFHALISIITIIVSDTPVIPILAAQVAVLSLQKVSNVHSVPTRPFEETFIY